MFEAIALRRLGPGLAPVGQDLHRTGEGIPRRRAVVERERACGHIPGRCDRADEGVLDRVAPHRGLKRWVVVAPKRKLNAPRVGLIGVRFGKQPVLQRLLRPIRADAKDAVNHGTLIGREIEAACDDGDIALDREFVFLLHPGQTLVVEPGHDLEAIPHRIPSLSLDLGDAEHPQAHQ